MQTKKIISMVLVICAIMLTACTNGMPQAESNVSEASATPSQNKPQIENSPMENQDIVLYPAGLDIAVGKSIILTAKTNGTQSVEWVSSDPSVATVEPNGTVHTISKGETTITASSAGSNDICRITTTEGGMTLAYLQDPGPLNEEGNHEPVHTEENYPVIIPDDQDSINAQLFEDAEYSWQLIIDDGFDTQLNVPNMNFSYMVKYHIYLDAHRIGGSAVTGDFEGTMDMEMAIDEASFLSAMKSMDVPATNMNFAAQTKTVDVSFSMVPYQIDEINQAKNAYRPSEVIPIHPLVMPHAMAIASADTSTSGSVNIEIEDGGYGMGAFSDNSSIPYVIEVTPNGTAVLYLPKMLSMCNRNAFYGTLARLQIVKLP